MIVIGVDARQPKAPDSTNAEPEGVSPQVNTDDPSANDEDDLRTAVRKEDIRLNR